MFGVKASRKICEICVVDHNDNDDDFGDDDDQGRPEKFRAPPQILRAGPLQLQIKTKF